MKGNRPNLSVVCLTAANKKLFEFRLIAPEHRLLDAAIDLRSLPFTSSRYQIQLASELWVVGEDVRTSWSTAAEPTCCRRRPWALLAHNCSAV